MFIVIEIQTTSAAEASVLPPNVYSDRNEAESKYHEILMYAAKSITLKHGAVMLTEEGTRLKSECYIHEPEPEEEPEPEPESE